MSIEVVVFPRLVWISVSNKNVLKIVLWEFIFQCESNFCLFSPLLSADNSSTGIR